MAAAVSQSPRREGRRELDDRPGISIGRAHLGDTRVQEGAHFKHNQGVDDVCAIPLVATSRCGTVMERILRLPDVLRARGRSRSAHYGTSKRACLRRRSMSASARSAGPRRNSPFSTPPASPGKPLRNFASSWRASLLHVTRRGCSYERAARIAWCGRTNRRKPAKPTRSATSIFWNAFLSCAQAMPVPSS